MKGAEIALVNGMRVKVGSSPDCDIVIADTTLADVAFELDVSDEGVTLVKTDGEMRALTAFEIADSGTTAIAVGPADEPWKDLVRPAPSPAEVPVEAAPESAPAAEEPSEQPEESEPEPAPAEKSEAEAEPKRRHRAGCGCLTVLVLLLLLALVAWILWKWCPAAKPWLEKATPAVTWVRETSVAGWNWCVEKCRRPVVTVESDEKRTVRVTRELADLAKEHGLVLAATEDGLPLLKGNLLRRTERLAIRALALASDPRVKFDLTDDESLRNSANELLFACTEGALKSVAATNRRVTVTGYAPNALALEKAIRALDADVKGIESLDTSSVVVGGLPPAAVAKSSFVKDSVISEAASAAPKAAKPRLDYPIAGILTEPYPCVVMRNGLRLVEGAQIGPAVLVKIEADRLTLREGDHEFEWRP